jgi:hypothetical protein
MTTVANTKLHYYFVMVKGNLPKLKEQSDYT